MSRKKANKNQSINLLLKGLKAKSYKVLISASDINKKLDWFVSSFAKPESVDRAAKDGDLVEVDVRASFNGEPVSGLQASDLSFVLGKGQLKPELIEPEIIGMAPRDERRVSLVVPELNRDFNLEPGDIDFYIKVNKVSKLNKPDFKTEVLSKLGFKQEDEQVVLDKFEASVRYLINEHVFYMTYDSLMDAVANGCLSFEPSAARVERKLKDNLDAAKQSLRARGVENPEFDLETFNELSIKQARVGEIVERFALEHALFPGPEQVYELVQTYTEHSATPDQVMAYYLSCPHKRRDIEIRAFESNIAEHMLRIMDVEHIELAVDDLGLI